MGTCEIMEALATPQDLGTVHETTTTTTTTTTTGSRMFEQDQKLEQRSRRDPAEDSSSSSPMSVRQVAELAGRSAASNTSSAATTTTTTTRSTISNNNSSSNSSSNSNETAAVPAAASSTDEREKLMRAPPRRGVSRHKSSSGGGVASGGGVGVGGAASGNFRKKPQLLRAQSMRVSHLPPKSSLLSSSSFNEPHRGTLHRANSSAAGHPPGSSRGGMLMLGHRPGVARTNSQRSLAHMHGGGGGGPPSSSRNGLLPLQPLQRTMSHTDNSLSTNTSGLRPYRGREQVVNQSIQRHDSSTSSSNGSHSQTTTTNVGNQSVGELSAFTMGTMDSVSLRKAQIVADPLDDQTYHEGMSFADHDSISMMSDFPDYTEFLPGQLSASSHNPAAARRHLLRRDDSMSGTFCTLDSVQLRQHQQTVPPHPNDAAGGDYFCDDASFSTIASRDLCFEAHKDFDEYSCLDEYSSRELLDNVEAVKEVDEYDYEEGDENEESTNSNDDDDELLNLGNVVIEDDDDDSDDAGELLEEDEDDADSEDK
jgi:hypothetical protein